MRPALVTVLTTAAWEPRLVEVVRARGMAKLRGRCATPAEVESRLGEVDAIVIGGETPWLTPELCLRWRRRGVRVVGVATHIDRPARRLLSSADLVVEPGDVGDRLVARIAGLARAASEPTGATVAVVGPRGTPGRTEISLALAWEPGRPGVFVEVDGEAPGMQERLAGSTEGPACFSIPPGAGPLAATVAARMLETARLEFGLVVIDGGPRDPSDLPVGADAYVLVVDPTSAGLTRAERLVETWTGPTPELVLNRWDGHDSTIRRARRATGLEPSAVVPRLPQLRLAPPDRRLLCALEPVRPRLPVHRPPAAQ